jgi:uncharacterized membrane protein YdjX (TVP38/TMEM64 family)
MDSPRAGDSLPSRRAAVRRLIVYGVLLATVFAVVAITGWLPSADEARDWGNDLGAFIYVAFVPLFVICNFAITWPILAGAAGLLFGTAVGTPLALAGVTAAGVTQMFVARHLAAGHHGALLPQRTRGVERFLTENGAVAVMESRIVPILPVGTTMPYRDLALGTIVGAAPKTFAYVALGGNLTDLGSPEAIVALALLIAFALMGGLLVRRRIALGGA